MAYKLTTTEARELRPVVRAMKSASARIDGGRASAEQLSDWAGRLGRQIAEALCRDRQEEEA